MKISMIFNLEKVRAPSRNAFCEGLVSEQIMDMLISLEPRRPDQRRNDD